MISDFTEVKHFWQNDLVKCRKCYVSSSLIFIDDDCKMQVYVLAQLLTDELQFSWASLVILTQAACTVINILMTHDAIYVV